MIYSEVTYNMRKTVVAILSIILVVTAVIGSDATGIVGKTFSDLITNFSNHANMSVK